MATRRSRIATAAGVVLLCLLGGCGALAFAVYRGIQGREVGPDADEIAKDPVLHLQFDGATPDELRSSQGTEGGIAPAFANSSSEASRAWHSETDDWLGLVVEALMAVDAEGARWTRLSCYDDMMVASGQKAVDLGSDRLWLFLDVYLSEIGSPTEPLRLWISLSGDDENASSRPPLDHPPQLDANCPAELAAVVAPGPGDGVGHSAHAVGV